MSAGPTTEKPIVLHIGDTIKHNHDQYEEFLSKFTVIRPSTEERCRAEFIIALKERRWGNFDAIFRPYWVTGGEMGRWDAELISLLPKSVKVFASAGAGYDWADVDKLAQHGIHYCNGAGASSEAVADMAIFHILSVFRNLTWTHLAARSLDPEQFMDAHANATTTAHNPRGHSLGVVGMGNIGTLIAKKAFLAFGMKINYFDIVRKSEEVESELDATFFPKLDELFRTCDCIVLAAPGGTGRLIDAAALANFKPGSRLVNVARGILVDEDAVADAIESGRLFAAGLDVFENEPKINSRLPRLRQVTLTCHNAGGAIETNYGFESMAMKNITAVLTGREPLTSVNKQFLVE